VIQSARHMDAVFEAQATHETAKIGIPLHVEILIVPSISTRRYAWAGRKMQVVTERQLTSTYN
jgi:hypothetical protein